MVKTTSLLPYKITKKYRENQTFSRLFFNKNRILLYHLIQLYWLHAHVPNGIYEYGIGICVIIMD